MVDPHLVLLIYYVYPLAVYATIKYPISLQPLVWAHYYYWREIPLRKYFSLLNRGVIGFTNR